VITIVNHARRMNAALQQTNQIAFAETSNEQIICYGKWDGSNIIIIAVNLDPFNTQEGTVRLPLEKFNIPHNSRFRVKDFLSGDKFEWSERNFVRLNPYEMPAHVMVVERIFEN
jgi:starch synthase (maltosyl-transferring)